MYTATRLCIVLTLTLFLCALTAMADSITVKGKKHEGVIVRQSDTRYYIQDPADGSVFSVDKSAVPEGDVCLSSTSVERAALQQRWERAKRGESDTESAEVPVSTYEAPGAAVVSNERTKPIRITADASSRRIGSPRSYDAPVTAPSPLRGPMGNPGALRTRAINLGLGGDTMPKIVVSNSGGRGGAFAPGGSGFGGAGGYGSSQFSNITQLFSNIDDTLVGETPAPLGNEIIVLR